MNTLRIVLSLLLLLPCCSLELSAAPRHEIRALFLGDNAAHRPADRFKQLEPALREHRIELTYTDSLADLNPAKLTGFDCLIIFANHTRIEPAQEAALLEFVANGGGLAALHCASFCFLNSPKYIELVGAQFKSHGGEVFKETIVQPAHPVMEGLTPIESWDETYVHHKHNPDRIVLSERRDSKGEEPYTWVREHGKGRVFYTAWGHDQRTWSNPGFHALVENGIRWASANSPAQLKVASGLKPLEYMPAPAPLPNYVPNARWGTQAEPIRTMQKPLPPEESIKHLAVFPGFSKSLFASEPNIVKPIWLSWDERGRLWIAETVDYPNEMRPPGEGRDRLKILEDTNGDGQADKFTIFAEGLSVPTSFVFANGGVIVVHSGKTEFLKDTDGDDRADERRDLFIGWGTNDTHAGPSNLRYGFDNWIWGVVGYSGFRGTVGGKELRFGQGIFRFKPDGSALEFVRSSNNNTWGLGISEEGIVFGSTANGNASMYLPIANRYYEAVNGWSATRLETIADSQRFYALTEKVRQVDFHDRYTAGAGSAIYTARSFPKEYWNRVQFVAEPTGHLLGRFYLIPQGADFAAHNAANFLASDDEWTSPIAAEVGPDGALWVIDWYNYIIQHNPVPQGFRNGKGNAYETPLRDKTHGRIYRVAYDAAQPSRRFALAQSSASELIAALKSDNLQWRITAQRLIVNGKKTELVPELLKLADDATVDEIGLNPGAIHALWCLHGLNVLSDGPAYQAAVRALKHPSAGVRRAAVSVLPPTSAALEAIRASGSLDDQDAQVRLAALLALSEMPASARAGAAIFAMLQHSKNSEDRWIPDAATSAAARHDAGFLQAVLASYKPAVKTGSVPSAAPGNAIENGSFEQVQDGRPARWRPVTHSGRGQAAMAETGRTGTRSVTLTSENGADISWAFRAQVKPRTDYRLTGWIKTEAVQKIGGAHGAMLNIHELQDPVRGATKALTGDNDWTQVQLTFNTGQLTELTVNCLFGGWGRARGRAYFDDIELTPAPGAELAGEVGRVVRIVTTHYAQRAPADSILDTLAALKGASPLLAVPVLDGLVNGWPEGKAPELDARARKDLSALMEALPENVRDRLLALSLRWGAADLFGSRIKEITASLQDRVRDQSSSDEERIAAAKRLVGLEGTAASVQTVLEQVTPLTPPALASGLISAMTESRDTNAAAAVIDRWPEFTPGMKRNAAAALLRRREWTAALLEAVDKRRLNRTEIAAEHWEQLRRHSDRFLARRAARLSAAPSAGAGSGSENELVTKLLPLAKQKGGDPRHGKDVYAAACAVCHTFNGQGGKVGPDLTGIAARDPGDILLDILDPNRSVEANYQLWTVTTRDDETFSGRLEAETQTTVEILDTTGNKHVIQRKDIAKMQGSSTSIMPGGFEQLPEEDLKSLLAYLTTPH